MILKGICFPVDPTRGPTLRSFQTAQMAAESALGRRGQHATTVGMLHHVHAQRGSCCTMRLHRATRYHKVCTQAVHRQTGQEDTIFNMPPEHTQQSANAGCASSVLSAYTRVLAGPKPSVVHDLHHRVHVRLEVGDLHLRVHVHEPSASSASARFSSARNSALLSLAAPLSAPARPQLVSLLESSSSARSWLSASSARFSSARISAASFSSCSSVALPSSMKALSASITGCCLGFRVYTRRASSCCPSSYL